MSISIPGIRRMVISKTTLHRFFLLAARELSFQFRINYATKLHGAVVLQKYASLDCIRITSNRTNTNLKRKDYRKNLNRLRDFLNLQVECRRSVCVDA